MSRYRRPTKKSKYYVEKRLYDAAVHWVRLYPDWVQELKEYDTGQAIRYDRVQVQTSGNFDPTEAAGIRKAELSQKVELVEDAAREAVKNNVLRMWILYGVTNGIPFDQLAAKGIPCGKDMFYESRRAFYYHVAQRIR